MTLLGTTRPLPSPFFVLASQNPIELEGTYPLPEAQLDRFLFKLRMCRPPMSTSSIGSCRRGAGASRRPRGGDWRSQSAGGCSW